VRPADAARGFGLRVDEVFDGEPLHRDLVEMDLLVALLYGDIGARKLKSVEVTPVGVGRLVVAVWTGGSRPLSRLPAEFVIMQGKQGKSGRRSWTGSVVGRGQPARKHEVSRQLS